MRILFALLVTMLTVSAYAYAQESPPQNKCDGPVLNSCIFGIPGRSARIFQAALYRTIGDRSTLELFVVRDAFDAMHGEIATLTPGQKPEVVDTVHTRAQVYVTEKFIVDRPRYATLLHAAISQVCTYGHGFVGYVPVEDAIKQWQRDRVERCAYAHMAKENPDYFAQAVAHEIELRDPYFMDFALESKALTPEDLAAALRAKFGHI